MRARDRLGDRHVTIPANTHMTHNLTKAARRLLSDGYDSERYRFAFPARLWRGGTRVRFFGCAQVVKMLSDNSNNALVDYAATNSSAVEAEVNGAALHDQLSACSIGPAR